MPPRQEELSQYARDGVKLGYVLQESNWSIAQLVAASGGKWTESTVRRRLERARYEMTRDVDCACGCSRSIPRYSRADRETATDACQKRLQRRRRGGRKPPPASIDTATRRLRQWQEAVRSSP